MTFQTFRVRMIGASSIAAAFLLHSAAFAQKPNDYTNGLNGTPNIPSASIGGVDKTAAGALIPPVQGSLDATFGNKGQASLLNSRLRNWCGFEAKPIRTRADIQDYLAHDVPRAILCLGTQVRFGDGATVFSQEALYSSLTTGLDVAIQPFASEVNRVRRDGAGIALRFDLAPGDADFKRNERALARIASGFRAILNEKTDGEQKSVASRAFDVLAKNRPVQAQDLVGGGYLPLVSDFLKAHYTPHLAILANYRFLSGGLRAPANDLTTLGFVASKQTPLGQRKQGVPSLTGIFTLQGLTFGQSGASRTSAVRTGFGVTLQNRAPALSDDGKRIERWNFQVGADYLFQNRLDGGDNVSAFVRFRDTRNNFDYMVYSGAGSHRSGYFGVSVTGSIRLY